MATKAFDGSDARMYGRSTPILGELYRLTGRGQERVRFMAYGPKDYCVWNETTQNRIATYRTRRELQAAWEDWSATAAAGEG